MKFPTIKDFLECVDYRVTESATFLWKCYGSNARIMDYWNGEHNNKSVSVSAIYDEVTSKLYAMEVSDGPNSRDYRWICQEYRKLHSDEAIERGVDDTSIGDNKFIELEVFGDILEKSRSIFLGKEYDTGILINISMTAEEENYLRSAAALENISLEDFILRIIENEIGSREPE